MPKGMSTTNQQKKQTAKKEERERKVRRAHNILVRNTSAKERAGRRGEDTVQVSRKENPMFAAIRKMTGGDRKAS
jgi:hypothetical protein